MITMILQVTFKNQVCRSKADAPCRGGRQIAHIDGKKVASSREHVQASATGGTAGPGGDKTALQGCQQPVHLCRPTRIQLRRDGVLQGQQHRPYIRPARLVR
ncbi:hypothetical protein D3C77_611350 [compost metagenome]